MTACVNKNHGRRVAGVVTASLVGALTLGGVSLAAVPTVALAEQGGSLQTLQPQQAFANGTVAAQDGKGGNVTFPAKDPVSFTTSSGKYLLPTSITVAGDEIGLNLKAGSGNAIVKYYSGAITSDSGQISVAEVGLDADVTKLAKNYDWKAGTYTAVITFKRDGSQYENAKKYVTFKVVDADLSEAVVFNATGSNTDVSKTGFTYNGSNQEVGLAVDGKALDEANDYDIEVHDPNGHIVAQGAIKVAGTYTAYVFVNGHSNNQPSIKTITFSVAQLDLSKANLSVDDVKYGYPAPTVVKANGFALTSGIATADGDKVTLVPNNGTTLGEYSAAVTADEGNKNVVGSASVTWNLVTSLVDTGYTYDGTNFDSGATVTVDLAKGEEFDESLIKVAGLDAKDFDVTYVDKTTGEAVDASALSKKGEYYVNVRVNAERSGYAKGSAVHTLTVEVVAPVVKTDEVVFKYKGEVAANPLAKTYDGEDLLAQLTESVTSGKKTLTEGTDYTVVVLDESGKKAEKIVDAGSYTVEVKSDTYTIQGGKLDVVVKPVNLNYLYAKSDLMQTYGSTTLIPYTGKDIEPAFRFGYYTDAKGNVVAEGTKGATWNELPEGTIVVDGYKLTKDAGASYESVDGLKDAGSYRVFVSTGDGVVNYDISTLNDSMASAEVLVSKKGVFSDVPTGEWFSESVYAARTQGYIKGYSGTTMFGPSNAIKRGDVAVVLMNMATANSGSDALGDPIKQEVSKDQIDEYVKYSTKFSDVDSRSYYAASIGWAAKLGIVNGYGDGTFDPEKYVTRQEFATMLANYAAAKGEDVNASTDDALSKLPDADQVAGWAKESVEWAIDKGIMGKGGSVNPNGTITRAEVAAMAVDYQPKAPSNSDLLQ